MRLKGKKIEGPNREIIAIPRGDGDDIVFIAQAVLEMEPFEKMCPPPIPPIRKIKGKNIPNLKDKNYEIALDTYATKRMAWMVLTSLEATPELEWETVDVSDSSTWMNFRDELKDAGFSDIEVNRVVAGVVSVNALSEAKIEAARDRFLLSQQAQEDE